MRLEISTFYEICGAYLKQKGHQNDPQTKMTTEVFVTALVAAWFFANNLRLACAVLAEMGVVPQMLSESRFCRRQKITPDDWQAILTLLSERFPADTFAVDSCPMPVCHNQRASRSRLYRDENKAYWAIAPPKKRIITVSKPMRSWRQAGGLWKCCFSAGAAPTLWASKNWN